MGNECVDFNYLKRCSLFGGVTEDSFEHLRPYIRRQSFPAGTVILAEGSVNDRIYFIETGRVEITKATSSEIGTVDRHIVTMAAGDTFGEMELIDIQPCEASVRAIEDTVTLTLSNHDLYRVSKVDMKTYAMLIMNLAREISRRLRQTDRLFVQRAHRVD
ncbi:MAG TPA: cyclic nucleotide-binding domain-containing protein [Desulfobacterales bacterium]|nr:cyclic nucleotide-binding domain-containing protein [Desulfobacterales bacterium]